MPDNSGSSRAPVRFEVGNRALPAPSKRRLRFQVKRRPELGELLRLGGFALAALVKWRLLKAL
jgi:hypothetical protein